SAEIGANTRGGGNASVNVNYNSSKVAAFAGVGFRMRHNKGGSLMRRDFDNGTYTNSDGESPFHGNGIFFRLGATYHATDKDDISANGFGMFGHNWGHSTTSYLSNVPGNWTSNLNISRSRGDMKVAHGELSYVHKWSDNHLLDITGSYNFWGNDDWTSYLQDIVYQEMAGETVNKVYQERNMVVRSNSWEAKVDYTNQLNDNLKLEAGYNGNFSHENSPIEYYTGTDQVDMSFNPARYNRFIYSNDINAFYATLGGKVRNFSFSAGLRAEQWQVRTRSLSCLGVENGVPDFESKSDVPEFKKNNFALFPSAFISWSLPHDNEVQINYTRRLRRPWGGQLNSFRDYSNPTNVSYGNPELEPQYSNSFELNYLKSWTYHIISVSAYMRTTSNMLNRVSALDGEVMYSTWANVADQNNAGCEIVVKNSLFHSRLDLTTTVNLYNNHIGAWTYNFIGDNGFSEVISGDKQNSFAWDARIMASVRLPWSLSLQATGNYNSKMLTAQGSRQGGWGLNLGIRKNVGAWSFSLNCRDVFNSRRFKSTTTGPGYTQHDERWRGGTSVRLTIKYSFGNMKGKQQRERGGDEMEMPSYESAGMQ
ncbi:MAG: outer membrane beta-barrel family protein, partial [Muribaculaceae bacterium]|nr:outer membrane beta-barrel family protein [Muribaculaceae bacterium]